MTTPQRRPDLAAPAAASVALIPAAPEPPRPRGALMRRVEVAWLDGGRVEETTRLVPAIPAFEDAFAAFARGTLFATDEGSVAVEDLWPGARLRLAQGGLGTLLWRGATMIVPQAEGQGAAQDPAMSRLTRVAEGALGPGRPGHDLVLGPRARLVRRGAGVRHLTGGEAALVLAAELADGERLIALAPPAPVQAFHLGLEWHERLIAQGVEVESYHPGPAHALPARPDLLGLWLACFPHKADLQAFGAPCLPRLSREDLDLIEAA